MLVIILSKYLRTWVQRPYLPKQGHDSSKQLDHKGPRLHRGTHRSTPVKLASSGKRVRNERAERAERANWRRLLKSLSQLRDANREMQEAEAVKQRGVGGAFG